MTQSIVQVDAFADRPFVGNPAGVCIMKKAADETWMQSVAAEMNLSETAFLYPIETGYHLRWFTPLAEVRLCGHATLATAYVLFTDGYVPKTDQIIFHTLSGDLIAAYDDGWIELDFPVRITSPCTPPAGLLEALGVTSEYVANAGEDYLVVVDSDDIVRAVKPDFNRLSGLTVRGISVTAKAAKKYDFVSRFFAPAVGINEDPVTGSVHCALTHYWSQQLGKKELFAYQASQRGGELRLRLEGDRVKIRGKATITIRGELTC
ncbi:MAG: PhzF family phenazine biosynthesis protein [Candidatus Zixiibacteriota bacterium]